ncbi:hypothetical protein ACYOEI_20590, partial [Singulisphaera rosea]
RRRRGPRRNRRPPRGDRTRRTRRPKSRGGAGGGDPEPTYERIRAQLAQAYGWTFATIDEMSFDAIDSALREGKPPAGVEISCAEDIAEVSKNWRLYYQGL